MDIINSSLGVIALCAVHVLKQGGGVLELTRCLDEVNGVSEINRRRAEHLYERAKKLAFMESAAS